MNTLLKGALAALALGLASQASAATTYTYCPGTGDTDDREFGVMTQPNAAASATCLMSASGNNDNNDDFDDLITNLGVSLIDKFESPDDSSGLINGILNLSTGLGATSGTFSINTLLIPPGYVLTNLVLVLKSGVAGLDPDFAVFSLPDGVFSGNWEIDNSACDSLRGGGCNGDISLSHFSLYGQLVPAQVPLPAGGLLLLGGLGGLAFLRRRKSA